MDKDLDEGIKGFQLSLEKSEKVLLHNHVNQVFWFREGRLWNSVASGSVNMLCYTLVLVHTDYTGEIWKHSLFLRLGLPSTLIRHENEAFRKRYSNRRNLATPALRLLWTENIWITGLYETQVQWSVIVAVFKIFPAECGRGPYWVKSLKARCWQDYPSNLL